MSRPVLRVVNNGTRAGVGDFLDAVEAFCRKYDKTPAELYEMAQQLRKASGEPVVTAGILVSEPA